MIKIRLARGGAKNAPFYRIVAINVRSKREGAPLDTIGYWHPAKNVKKIDKKKLQYWQNRGAKTTTAVENIIGK
jgi:small subunit ribosomal protein S16